MEKLYQKSEVIKSLKEYFDSYILSLSSQSGKKLFLLLLSMITMQFVTSIKFVYDWFLSKFHIKSLNSYYHLLNYANIPLDKLSRVTINLAMSLIPENLRKQPIFLIIDDTLQEKFGVHFEECSKLFDHAKHNGTNYLNGHCFVALSLRIPVIVSAKIRYLNIPLKFKLYSKGENKLQIAANMIDFAMESMENYPQVILLCDSWYPKSHVCNAVKRHPNLELIANVRYDSRLYDLPVKIPGKRGPKPKRGKRLNILNDFSYSLVDKYYTATKTVLCNLFEEAVYVTITTTNLASHKAYRVFISTILPENIIMNLAEQELKELSTISKENFHLLPLRLYSLRWDIELMFYELKTYWSFGKYMIRSKVGITNYINFLSICYACVKMLPFTNAKFSSLKNESPQTTKYMLSQFINRDLYLLHFAPHIPNMPNLNSNIEPIDLFNTFHHSA